MLHGKNLRDGEKGERGSSRTNVNIAAASFFATLTGDELRRYLSGNVSTAPHADQIRCQHLQGTVGARSGAAIAVATVTAGRILGLGHGCSP
jgi:hypothetical protein